MKPSVVLSSSAALLCLFLFLGDASIDGVSILAPFPGDSVSYDTGKLFIVSAAKEPGGNLLVSSQWEIDTIVDLSSKSLKEEFPRTFVGMIPPAATLQSVRFVQRFFRGYSKPDSLGYAYADTVSIASLWVDPAFVAVVKKLQGVEVLSVIVTMRGWKDTTLEPVYDDPAADNRALFKVPVRLVPGPNEVRFAPAGVKARSTVFLTRYAHESAAAAERPSRFHNSETERGCASCHDGLPSADGGATMTADCASCHREHSLANYIHGPVEMTECASCHSWSAEQGAVVVGAGIPVACAACHAEKVAAVDSAAVPHAVAPECATCHSPHSSDREHLLKDDTNKLCAGCHEGFDLNHPVGRHPVRFKTVASTGKEISCVSCHDPHGSANPKLLMTPNGSMELCSRCH